MRRLLFATGMCLLLVSGRVVADTFVVDEKKGQDTVYFRSTAKLEFIEGKSNAVEGSFSFDPQNVTQPISGIIRVDLRTLKTGIDTRDGHMRDRHLNTDTYPFAYFQVESVTGLPDSLEVGRTYLITASGSFFIHGGKRKIEAPTEVTLSREADREILTVRPKFSLRLDDYKIERPKALFLKLAETIDVELIFAAYNNLSAPDIMLPDWPELK